MEITVTNSSGLCANLHGSTMMQYITPGEYIRWRAVHVETHTSCKHHLASVFHKGHLSPVRRAVNSALIIYKSD